MDIDKRFFNLADRAFTELGDLYTGRADKWFDAPIKTGWPDYSGHLEHVDFGKITVQDAVSVLFRVLYTSARLGVLQGPLTDVVSIMQSGTSTRRIYDPIDNFSASLYCGEPPRFWHKDLLGIFMGPLTHREIDILIVRMLIIIIRAGIPIAKSLYRMVGNHE